MTTAFEELAAAHDLEDRRGTSPDGLPERYLYSRDMVYRYAFARWWGDEDLATTDVWVLLNPATGDTEKRRRPTLERCIARSRAADSTGLLIVNLFAYRRTDPKQLRFVDDPVGPANDDVLRRLTTSAPRTIVAWGRDGRLNKRSRDVVLLLTEPLCLGVTKQGEPLHPLFVKSEVGLEPWKT